MTVGAVGSLEESAPQQLVLGNALKFSFTGHQTFPFRYSWLPKGVEQVKTDPEIFFQDDALVRLGVGKNMVNSIRFWCEALELISVDGRNRCAELLPLGEFLFGKAGAKRNGKDPYLEDPGTLWLLHWQLASRPELASTWYLAFTRWNRNVFTRDQLVKWILQVAQQSSATRSSLGSIKRDVDVFLRTYIPADEDRRRPLEDSFDCPLGELGLIRKIDEGYFQFNQDPKPSLPVEIFAYAVVNFWNVAAPNQDSVNLERLLYDPGSPGGAFKLTDKSTVQLLEALPPEYGLRYDETAGLRVLVRTSQQVFEKPQKILIDYYQSR